MNDFNRGRVQASLEIIRSIAYDDDGIRAACNIIGAAVDATPDAEILTAPEPDQPDQPAAEPAAPSPAMPLASKWDADMLREEFATAEVESVTDAVVLCIDGLGISFTELAEITGVRAAYLNSAFLGETPKKSVLDYFSALLPGAEGGAE